jgi:hypothetical protein
MSKGHLSRVTIIVGNNEWLRIRKAGVGSSWCQVVVAEVKL